MATSRRMKFERMPHHADRRTLTAGLQGGTRKTLTSLIIHGSGLEREFPDPTILIFGLIPG